jgi:HprK-related kinase B
LSAALPFAQAVERLCAGRAAPHALVLRLEELTVRVRSNNAALAEDLRGYFAPFLAPDLTTGLVAQASPDFDCLLLDGPVAEPPVELAVRRHLPGKRPDKERFADLPGDGPGDLEGGGRIVRKQATGMLFAFGGADGAGLAVGPCAQNRNQLVNFICARYMERRVAAGWRLGHAAGVAPGGRGLALCGFAGMGKSTLALHLLALGCDFLTNDRALIEPAAGEGRGAVLHGIPKHPRLNPGTALGNPALSAHLERALPAAKRAAYAGLAAESLYAVEDKYDALIDACFPPAAGACSRFRLRAPLAGLIVLNWRHGGGPMRAQRVDLRARRDLLDALRKPPGVFYREEALATARLSEDDFLDALTGVPVLELSGGSDFPAGARACLDLIT